MIDPRLDGRVALITGANHGIGAAAARSLAAQGAPVFLTYLRLDPSRQTEDPGLPRQYGEQRAGTADHVVEEIRSAGGRAGSMEADLSDPRVPALVFERAEAALGPVEILVNNASGWLADTFLPTAADRFGRTLQAVGAATFERQFAVDCRAAALLMAEFARRHLARGARWGRIIGLTSGGADGFPQEVSYGAAKAALENYTMSAAHELGPHGVTANIVHPPPTDTGWVTPAVEAAILSSGPLGHVAQPEEVAEVITFLASHQARFVTAQIVRMR